MNEEQNNNPDMGGNPQNEGQFQQQNYQQNDQGQQQNYQQNNQGQYQPQPPTQPKSKIAAGLLGILLGAFGAHNFYLGFKKKAIIQLLITLLTCGFGAPISSIWGLIEGIMILTNENPVDANGYPLAK